MMLDEEMDFFLFFRRKLQSFGGAVQSGETAGNVVFHRHSFAHIVQQQRQNQQVSPLSSLPEWREMRASFVGRFRQFLQVLDGAQ